MTAASASSDAAIFARLAAAPGITAGSRANYATSLRRALRIYRVEHACPDASVSRMLLTPSATMDAFASKAKTRTAMYSLVQALKAVLKHAPDAVELPAGGPTLVQVSAKWTDIATRASEAVKEQVLSGEPSDRQAEARLEWARVFDQNASLRAAARERPTRQAVDDMLLSDFYVLLEPRRVMDYSAAFVRLVDGDEPPEDATAVVDLRTAGAESVEVRRYKTVKSHGVWRADLPKLLVADLRFALALFPRTWLFAERNGARFKNSDRFSKFNCARLATWFGVDATPTTLRHSRATQVVVDPTLSLKEKHEIAQAMGHSYETHMQYAFKIPRNADGSFEIPVFDPERGRYVVYLASPSG